MSVSRRELFGLLAMQSIVSVPMVLNLFTKR